MQHISSSLGQKSYGSFTLFFLFLFLRSDVVFFTVMGGCLKKKNVFVFLHRVHTIL